MAACHTLVFTFPDMVISFDADNYPFVFLSKCLNVSFNVGRNTCRQDICMKAQR